MFIIKIFYFIFFTDDDYAKDCADVADTVSWYNEKISALAFLHAYKLSRPTDDFERRPEGFGYEERREEFEERREFEERKEELEERREEFEERQEELEEKESLMDKVEDIFDERTSFLTNKLIFLFESVTTTPPPFP